MARNNPTRTVRRTLTEREMREAARAEAKAAEFSRMSRAQEEFRTIQRVVADGVFVYIAEFPRREIKLGCARSLGALAEARRNCERKGGYVLHAGECAYGYRTICRARDDLAIFAAPRRHSGFRGASVRRAVDALHRHGKIDWKHYRQAAARGKPR